MSAAWRPASAYVHGIDGPAVVVPARVAAWLQSRAGLDRLRIDNRGVDPEVDAVLTALRVAALHWRAAATGSDPRKEPEGEAESVTWLTSAQAADSLGVGPRAIRLAIAEQRLPAERVGGRWLINREDVEHYRAARTAA